MTRWVYWIKSAENNNQEIPDRITLCKARGQQGYAFFFFCPFILPLCTT
jgi:hypothetical protein